MALCFRAQSLPRPIAAINGNKDHLRSNLPCQLLNSNIRPSPKPRSCPASSVRVRSSILPVDPWNPSSVDSQSIASSLFAASLFPYIGFLYHLTKSKTAPPLTLFGFYFLLAFVGATIPAGIYAKIHYGTSLSNVDYLHGSAESLLTITNLFIVLGLRKAIREDSEVEPAAADRQESDGKEK